VDFCAKVHECRSLLQALTTPKAVVSTLRQNGHTVPQNYVQQARAQFVTCE